MVATKNDFDFVNTEVVAQLRRQNFLLKLCVAVVACALLLILLSAANGQRGKVSFEEVDVGRINVVNADGSRAMVLAARGLLPDPVTDGEVASSDRSKMPGMIFYNGVGDEVGGLIFDGKLDEEGEAVGGVHLSMDRYGGDQQIAMHHYEDNGFMETGLSVYDRGIYRDYGDIYDRYLRAPEGPEREGLLKRWKEAGGQQTQRLFVGRTRGRSSAVILADKAGHPRIIMSVTPDGEPSLNFMDDEGNVVQSLPDKEVLQ